MKNRTDFWNEKAGMSGTTLIYNRKDNSPIVGFGVAQCHPDDEDVKSERTGGVISEYKAEISLLKRIIANELKPELAGLLHLQGTMAISKKYNPNSYEAKRLTKEIKNLKREIADTKNMIEVISKDLREYITLKDKGKNR